ncbi:hypothetical protein E1A91_D05G341500v1 [Gossypium mustelinum]|uniref:Uncharacterized protein n=2 Tax=Gossypium TaxID=3633 RepID=A0A5D2V4F9_GOSMU|nr:hypothetical protein E1A91_D05G341500v1 [Gossypium mustelinum]
MTFYFCSVLGPSNGDCFLQNVDSSPSTGLPYGSWIKASPIKRSIQNAMEDYCDRVSNLSQIIARSLLGPGPSFFSDRIHSTTSSAPFDVSLDFEVIQKLWCFLLKVITDWGYHNFSF